MSKHDLAVILLRILGIYCVVRAAQAACYGLAMWAQLARVEDVPALSAQPVTSLAHAALAGLFGWVLLAKAPALARWITRDATEATEGTGPVTSREAHAIALSVVGAYLVAMGLGSVAVTIGNLVSEGFSASHLWGLDPLFRLILGIGLFFGAEGDKFLHYCS